MTHFDLQPVVRLHESSSLLKPHVNLHQLLVVSRSPTDTDLEQSLSVRFVVTRRWVDDYQA